MTDKELIEVLLDRSRSANDECRTDDADAFDSAATCLQELTAERDEKQAALQKIADEHLPYVEKLEEECRTSMLTIAEERTRAEAAEAKVAELERALRSAEERLAQIDRAYRPL